MKLLIITSFMLTSCATAIPNDPDELDRVLAVEHCKAKIGCQDDCFAPNFFACLSNEINK